MNNLNPLLLLEARYKASVAAKKVYKGILGKVRNTFRKGSEKRFNKIRRRSNMRGATDEQVINRMRMDSDSKVAKSGDVMPKFFEDKENIRIGKDAWKEDLKKTGEDFRYLGGKLKKGTGAALAATGSLAGLGTLYAIDGIMN